MDGTLKIETSTDVYAGVSRRRCQTSNQRTSPTTPESQRPVPVPRLNPRTDDVSPRPGTLLNPAVVTPVSVLSGRPTPSSAENGGSSTSANPSTPVCSCGRDDSHSSKSGPYPGVNRNGVRALPHTDKSRDDEGGTYRSTPPENPLGFSHSLNRECLPPRASVSVWTLGRR